MSDGSILVAINNSFTIVCTIRTTIWEPASDEKKENLSRTETSYKGYINSIADNQHNVVFRNLQRNTSFVYKIGTNILEIITSDAGIVQFYNLTAFSQGPRWGFRIRDVSVVKMLDVTDNPKTSKFSFTGAARIVMKNGKTKKCCKKCTRLLNSLT